MAPSLGIVYTKQKQIKKVYNQSLKLISLENQINNNSKVTYITFTRKYCFKYNIV